MAEIERAHDTIPLALCLLHRRKSYISEGFFVANSIPQTLQVEGCLNLSYFNLEKPCAGAFWWKVGQVKTTDEELLLKDDISYT